MRSERRMNSLLKNFNIRLNPYSLQRCAISYFRGAENYPLPTPFVEIGEASLYRGPQRAGGRASCDLLEADWPETTSAEPDTRPLGNLCWGNYVGESMSRDFDNVPMRRH